MGFLTRFIGPRGRGFELSFAQGVESSPIKKIASWFCRRGGGGGGRWSCDPMNDFHEIVKRACSFYPMGIFFLTGPPSFRHQ